MFEWLYFVLKCAYFFLPAYCANMAPVIFKKLSIKKYPVDFGQKFNGKRIFGKNKSWNGLAYGVIIAIIITAIQFFLLNKINFFNSLLLVDYTNWLLLGFLLGFGSLVGDLIESFIKRQINMAPGKSLPIIDQIDYVLGGLLFAIFAFPVTLNMAITLLLLSIILTIIMNHLSYFLKIREEKW